MKKRKRNTVIEGKFWRFETYKLPLRRIKVKGQGDFEVPRHIVRIDIDEPGKAGTHGWQVRYRGTILFSDAKVKNDAKRSLQQAKRYLKATYIENPPDPPSLPTEEHASRKSVLLGQRGVSLSWKKNRNRPSYSLYIQVSIPRVKNNRSRNIGIYVATRSTLTEMRLTSSLKKAFAIRRYAERMFRDGNDDALKSIQVSELPSSIKRAIPRTRVPKIASTDLPAYPNYAGA